MSQLIDYINSYSREFGVSDADRRKLVLHYPLLKAATIAAQATPGSRRHRLLGPLSGYEVSHTIAGGVRAGLPIHPSGFDSFAEIFFQHEYALDGEIDTFVDLGGNVGMASLYFFAHNRARRGVVVEANPRLIPQIGRRLAGVGGDATVVNAAVTGRNDPAGVPFHVGQNHRLSAVASYDGDGTVRVPTLELGSLLDRHGIDRADLLKMDIEGAEFDVLRASAGALRRFDRMFVEVHGGPDLWEEFRTGLRACGFSVEDRGSSPQSVTIFATRVG